MQSGKGSTHSKNLSKKSNTLLKSKSAQKETKQLKYLTKLVKLSLPKNSPESLYPKVTNYCVNLIHSRLFIHPFKEKDNYTNYI